MRGCKEEALESAGSYEEVQGSIGSLISLWVRIERCMEGLEPDRPEPAETLPRRSTVSQKLNRWQERMEAHAAERPFRAALAQQLRADLRKAKRVRDGVCHGLCGIMGASGGAPGRLTWHGATKEESLTWDEMQEHLAWLSKVPTALDILDSGNMSPHGRLVESLENRAWWAAEYGIILEA